MQRTSLHIYITICVPSTCTLHMYPPHVPSTCTLHMYPQVQPSMRPPLLADGRVYCPSYHAPMPVRHATRYKRHATRQPPCLHAIQHAMQHVSPRLSGDSTRGCPGITTGSKGTTRSGSGSRNGACGLAMGLAAPATRPPGGHCIRTIASHRTRESGRGGARAVSSRLVIRRAPPTVYSAAGYKRRGGHGAHWEPGR